MPQCMFFAAALLGSSFIAVFMLWSSFQVHPQSEEGGQWMAQPRGPWKEPTVARPAAIPPPTVPEPAAQPTARASPRPTRSPKPVLVYRYSGEQDGPVGGARPVPPLVEPDSTTPILVEISAFMDGERCAKTMERSLSQAQFPDRITFLVLQARNPGQLSCEEEYRNKVIPRLCLPGASFPKEACESELRERLNYSSIVLTDAMGPAHSRGLLSQRFQYRHEDQLCLSIDSHMDFVTDWDTKIIQEWVNTRNEFAILTHYAFATDGGTEDRGRGKSPDVVTRGMFLDHCGWKPEQSMTGDMIPCGKTASTMGTWPNQRPYLTMNWAAGLSFMRCHAERNVPVDHHLKWIFTGEEIDRAVRFWTHGYDFYLPASIAVLHNYSQAKQAFWDYKSVSSTERDSARRSSQTRIHSLLQTLSAGEQPVDLGFYGEGRQRTVKQFVEWSRANLGTPWKKLLDATTGAVDPDFNYCKKLKRVPVSNETRLRESVRRDYVDPG